MVRRITKTYVKNWLGDKMRAKEEPKLMSEGFAVESEEEIRKWNPAGACCLGLIFLPLIFFAYEKCVRVTYVQDIGA